MSETIISPSILSADFANLENEIKDVTMNGAKWIHFVPNITIGAPVVKSLRGVTNSKLDVHLMIENPEKYIPDFIKAGADVITFHIEASKEKTLDCIKMIKEANLIAGISIKPKTKVSEIAPYLKKIDMVLVMTVEPGFSGQMFMPKAAVKIKEIKEMAPNLKYIQVDGGINDTTAKKCKLYGANCLVAGNYVFKSDNRKYSIQKLLDA